MFGLTFEKLVVIAVIAALVIGPQRLPDYARRLGEWVRLARSFVDAARVRAAEEAGVSDEDWKALDPRQYDPRRIVRDAFASPEGAEDRGGLSTSPEPAGGPGDCDAPPDDTPRYIVVGTSAHPRRIRVDAHGNPLAAASATRAAERQHVAASIAGEELDDEAATPAPLAS